MPGMVVNPVLRSPYRVSEGNTLYDPSNDPSLTSSYTHYSCLSTYYTVITKSHTCRLTVSAHIPSLDVRI